MEWISINDEKTKNLALGTQVYLKLSPLVKEDEKGMALGVVSEKNKIYIISTWNISMKESKYPRVTNRWLHKRITHWTPFIKPPKE